MGNYTANHKLLRIIPPEGVFESTLKLAFSRADNSLLPVLEDKLDLPETELVQFEYINYGAMQRIYKLTLNNEAEIVAAVSQSEIEKGRVKQEFENLERLFEIDSDYMPEPLAFFEDESHALHVSKYIPNARCIYSGKGMPWGMFSLVPTYHFEEFPEPVASATKTAMIAQLINYYDDYHKLGLAKTQLSGDDFIFTEDFNINDPNSVLPNIMLISARDTFKGTLADYIDRIRVEFRTGIHYSDPRVRNGEFQINTKCRHAMTEDEIEKGIDLGITLRRSNNNPNIRYIDCEKREKLLAR